MRNGYPLVELHRHLDGNVRIQTIIDLALRHQLQLPGWEIETLRPYVQVVEPEPDLMSFIAKFDLLCHVMVDYDAIRRITKENIEDAAKEQIDYIELRFSPYFMAQRHNLDPYAITETVCDAILDAQKEFPVKAKAIVIMSRTFGREKCELELEAALHYRNHKALVALDLAGDEVQYPGSLFVDFFQRAREAGLHVIAHAGEATGAESVRQAVLELGVERVGHGITAANDEATIDLLLEKNIGIEVCPTSNVQTSTVPSYQQHPLPMFLERGLLVSLNTDDPGISGIDLTHEYDIVAKTMGIEECSLRKLQENALETAFLTSEERKTLLSEP